MKNIYLILVFLFSFVLGFSQAPTPNPFIKGDLNIRYNTRTAVDKTKEGVEDIYTLNINVSNSALFKGSIGYRPMIKGFVGTNQQSGLNYILELDVVNPNNPLQTRNIGKLYGFVPIDKDNIYRFSDGEVKASILSMGNAKGFESKFSGSVAGKPPAQENNLWNKFKKEAFSISKSSNGKVTTISITKYDKMDFSNHVLVAGPVQTYPEVTINGPLIYDYNRSAWLLDGVVATYVSDGRQLQDKINGSIRWIQNLGEYQFDIRVNEPAPSESAVFTGPADESAFFASDNTVPSLTGVMRYKDTISNSIVVSSSVQIDLVGNKLNKQQVMYLCKLFFLSGIVPLNSD